MDKEIITFGDYEIEKHKLCCYKSLIFLEDVDADKILQSKNIFKVKKAINTLLVNCIVIIRLTYYI